MGFRKGRGEIQKDSLHFPVDYDSEFPIQKYLIQYARNLVEVKPIQQKILEYILSILPQNYVKRIFDFLLQKSPNFKKITDMEENISGNLSVEKMSDNLFRWLEEGKKDIFDEVIFWFIRESLNEAAIRPTDVSGKQSVDESGYSKFKELKDTFLLSEEEIKIVCLCYCYTQSQALETLLDNENAIIQTRLIAIMTGINPARVRNNLQTNGRLVQLGLIEIENRSICFDFEITGSVLDYLNGFSNLSLLERYCQQYKGSAYDIDSFNLSPSKKEIILSLIRSNTSCHILLHGEAGSGKTEFAKSVGKECGKPVHFVKHESTSEKSNKRIALQVADRTIDPGKSIVVVDEADWLINTWRIFAHTKEPLDKEWLNAFMDNSSAQFIWVTNDVDFIDSSVLRRFTYHIHFRKFTRTQREKAWRRAIKGHPQQSFFTDEVVDYLAGKYDVNVSGIHLALEVLSRLGFESNKCDPEILKGYIEDILSNHKKLIDGTIKSNSSPVPKQYDLDALHVDTDIHEFIRSFEEYYRLSESGNEFSGDGFTALFWGMTGTGKTEFAKYVAYRLKREIYSKRVSDLLSPYIGMTEKNIRDAFNEAEENKAILLLDEADSLFINRENALQSWEISQTNELLTQMNSYQGALICCTNLLDILDNASIRRFDWKIEFRPLTDTNKVTVYKKYFSNGTFLEEKDLKRIQNIENLTFGDIYAVWRRLRFSKKKRANHDKIIRAIEKESEYRRGHNSNKIGYL
jgi:SpoVK/Ycf46/Vps4 family AAA+-type ATPase